MSFDETYSFVTITDSDNIQAHDFNMVAANLRTVRKHLNQNFFVVTLNNKPSFTDNGTPFQIPFDTVVTDTFGGSRYYKDNLLYVPDGYSYAECSFWYKWVPNNLLWEIRYNTGEENSDAIAGLRRNSVSSGDNWAMKGFTNTNIVAVSPGDTFNVTVRDADNGGATYDLSTRYKPGHDGSLATYSQTNSYFYFMVRLYR